MLDALRIATPLTQRLCPPPRARVSCGRLDIALLQELLQELPKTDGWIRQVTHDAKHNFLSDLRVEALEKRAEIFLPPLRVLCVEQISGSDSVAGVCAPIVLARTRRLLGTRCYVVMRHVGILPAVLQAPAAEVARARAALDRKAVRKVRENLRAARALERKDIRYFETRVIHLLLPLTHMLQALDLAFQL